MKTLYKSIFIALSLLIISCQSNKDEEIIEPNKEAKINRTQEEIVHVKHNYNFYEKEFSVTYVFNTKEQKVIDTYGDVEIAKEIFGKEKSPEGSLVLSKEEEGSFSTINFKIFNTTDEIDSYLEKKEKLIKATKSTTLNRNNCFNTSLSGESDVHFFEDNHYNREFMSIRGLDRRLHAIQYLSAENDKISSFYISSPKRVQISFYEHSCYSGKRLTFDKGFNSFYGVNDLSHYTLSGTWFWRKSWNDKASSFWMVQKY